MLHAKFGRCFLFGADLSVWPGGSRGGYTVSRARNCSIKDVAAAEPEAKLCGLSMARLQMMKMLSLESRQTVAHPA